MVAAPSAEAMMSIARGTPRIQCVLEVGQFIRQNSGGRDCTACTRHAWSFSSSSERPEVHAKRLARAVHAVMRHLQLVAGLRMLSELPQIRGSRQIQHDIGRDGGERVVEEW